MRNLLSILVVFFSILQMNSQELNCTVSVNADQVPGSNKQIFSTLETSLKEFLNQTQFTQYKYKLQERISCNFTLTISEMNGNTFKGNIQVQSSRPVFDSNYLTPVFNFKDSQFSFRYLEYEPLLFSDNTFESNLVSVVTYYAYVILGMDADTFALNGGLPYFKTAQNVVIQAQQSGFAGWNQNDGPRTRFMLVDNLLSPAFKLFHQSMYQYHLTGLDLMSKDQRVAKENIGESIYTLKEVYDARPAAFLIRIFMDSKSDEIVEIYSDGPMYDTFKLKEDLLKMSPLNGEKWDLIK